MRSLNKRCSVYGFRALKKESFGGRFIHFFLYYSFFQKHQCPFVYCFYMEFWLLASTKAAFGNKVITKETCRHFFVVWDFYLTYFFFLHPLAFYLYMFLFVWHFCIHHHMSGCNKAIIRWMDEEMTGIQTIQVFHLLCGWSFNSSLNMYICSYQDFLLKGSR